MKFTENQNELVWHDNPTGFRLFGLIFAIVGFLFPLVSLIQVLRAPDFASITVVVLAGMSLIFALMGILVIWISKTHEVKIDKLTKQVSYKCGKIERKFATNEVEKIEMVEAPDEDGDPTFTPHLKLKNGEYLQIYRAGFRSTDSFNSSIARFNNYLELA